MFLLPPAFYPNYARLGIFSSKNKFLFPYEFSYKLEIKSTKSIRLISVPKNSKVTKGADGRSVKMACDVPGDELKVYYRSDEMKTPSLIYGVNPKN